MENTQTINFYGDELNNSDVLNKLLDNTKTLTINADKLTAIGNNLLSYNKNVNTLIIHAPNLKTIGSNFLRNTYLCIYINPTSDDVKDVKDDEKSIIRADISTV